MAQVDSTSTDCENHRNESYSFIYGDQALAYQVVRKPLKAVRQQAVTTEQPASLARRISIRVDPDGAVVVTAPEDAERTAIHQAVMKRAKWIWDALTEFSQHQRYVQAKHYVSGEMQFYLGRRYVLKVVEPEVTFELQALTDELPPASVKMDRGKLRVNLPVLIADPIDRANQVKQLVDQWYRNRAEYIFQQRLQALVPQANWLEDIPLYRILPMQKQWGSCSAKGTLMLNPHLVKAPRECIDYVIWHELCHIAEYNHSERFWRLLTQNMPNWKEVKSRLDGMAELYLNE